MNARHSWIKAFPLATAAEAVKAVLDCWNRLAITHLPGFNPKMKEPTLTLVLATYLRYVISNEYGLRGQWGAENVGATIDYATAKIIKIHRTDICYFWNDEQTSLQLVIEFKKLGHTKSSRDYYLGEKGMLRFISGPYSKGQPIALMAGILSKDYNDCVPPLRSSLQRPEIASMLQLRSTDKEEAYCMPSMLFPGIVDFDTEHVRSPDKAPTHGTIRIAHFFLSFGYSPS